VSNRYRALQALRRFPHIQSVFPFGVLLHYADVRQDQSTDIVAAELRHYLDEQGMAGAEVEIIAPTVEDTFIARMGSV
jgi:hypothetical protein